MKRKVWGTIGAAIMMSAASPALAAPGLTTSVYHNYYSGSSQAADYTFTNTNDQFSYFGWWNTSVKDFLGPDAAGQALTDTGSIVNMRVDNQGFVNVDTAGTYNFNLSADDFAQLLIDGTLVANAPNYSTPGAGSIVLDAGFHTFDLNFAGFGDPNRLSLTISGPKALSFATSADVAAVPEPATWAMMLLGFSAIAFAMRSQRRQATRTALA